MTTRPHTKPADVSPDDHTFGEFLRKLGERIAEREAANPAPSPLPEPPPEPWVDKPGTLIAAEKDVWRWQLVEKLQGLLCGGPERCAHARSRRCANLEALKPEIEASHAVLAREQAAWKAPPSPPERTRRKRRKREL